MARSVSEKMGIKPGTRAILVDAPEDAVRALSLPPLDISTSMRGRFDYIHLFVSSRTDLARTLARSKPHLSPTGMLWVSWPKGKQLGTDLTLPNVIEIGYASGLVESTTLRVDDVWSAIKFTNPKPGTTYRNSYGKLPST